MCDPASHDRQVPVFAQVGLATTLLELGAASIGEGIVAGGFVAIAAGMARGRSRKELEGNALRHSFWGGLLGMSCLCLDLILRYPS
jgi:hypothetical protein